MHAKWITLETNSALIISYFDTNKTFPICTFTTQLFTTNSTVINSEGFLSVEVSRTSICPVEAHMGTAALENKLLFAGRNIHSLSSTQKHLRRSTQLFIPITAMLLLLLLIACYRLGIITTNTLKLRSEVNEMQSHKNVGKQAQQYTSGNSLREKFMNDNVIYKHTLKATISARTPCKPFLRLAMLIKFLQGGTPYVTG